MSEIKFTINIDGDNYYPETTADQVLFDDGETFQQKLDNGELKGEKGDQGIQGPKGDTGATGSQGADGLTTSISLNGQIYEQINGNITLPNLSIEHDHPYLTNDGNGFTLSNSTPGHIRFKKKDSDSSVIGMYLNIYNNLRIGDTGVGYINLIGTKNPAATTAEGQFDLYHTGNLPSTLSLQSEMEQELLSLEMEEI